MGEERFPAGAVLQLVSNGLKRELAPGFAATADAAVSFDGRRALFAGKRKASDSWRIWEMGLHENGPRRITREDEREHAIAPFYLPGDGIVYAQRTAAVRRQPRFQRFSRTGAAKYPYASQDLFPCRSSISICGGMRARKD